ncbi:MAG TPA: YbhB/YbcL family Raf kinase inhibitor-like protein [Candidatus Nanoarchaeia archaeon]|nr:YbhB/YbcL family Raf kinase inhibitor-like protein [Candidatus Nanoarchaeia archaeon]
MKKLLILFLIIVFIQGCSQQNSTEEANNNLEISNIKEGGMNMKVISNNFNNNQDIPNKFTCQGQNIRPHLKWSDFPTETKSFAISVIDPDAPMGDFVHWLIYNIPVTVTELKEGLEIPEESIEINNGAGKKEFIGPCPPSGKHRYFFRIYALKTQKLENINEVNFLEKVNENSLDTAEILGLYQKK